MSEQLVSGTIVFQPEHGADRSGSQALVDMHGSPIRIGDKLSWDFGDPYYQQKGVEDWMKEPVFVVEKHASGRGLCAVGIHERLYLHDFRFKFCERIAA